MNAPDINRVRPYYEISDSEWRAKLLELQGQPSPRVLLQGATIVTMDPNVPDLARGEETHYAGDNHQRTGNGVGIELVQLEERD